ncbi:MAG: hypothetical protein M1813_007892 [Trichoglossum hirsutum]|jgi:tRNA-specific adenosine deaminase 1|nr:MAG: hypothetical protein M1813_007892 [Trichoglossum hirsutum]
MELIMAAQGDATPWSLPLTTSDDDLSTGEATGPLLHGRGYFSQLGIVRRKPGMSRRILLKDCRLTDSSYPARPDAPPTLSKSCSDKLTLKQCTSVLSCLTSLFISPQNAYIHTIILPTSQHSEIACDRAFSPTGRMKVVAGREWGGGYKFRPFSVKTTSREFKFSRRGVMAKKLTASNISTVWTPNIQETLIGGVLQGRKQFDPRGASQICRRQMWKMVLDVVVLCGLVGLESIVSGCRYGQVKEGLGVLRERKKVKNEVTDEALKGWTRNDGDDGFQLGIY